MEGCPAGSRRAVIDVFRFGQSRSRKVRRAGTLDLARSPNEHIAFGTGPHGCLGQHIARVEIDAILLEILSRMNDLSLAAEPEWLPSNFISGPRKMPVRFSRA